MTSIKIATGYYEDFWEGSRLHAEGLVKSLKKHGNGAHAVDLFMPRCERSPIWVDRRLRYGKNLGSGDIFHQIDTAYADSILAARNGFQKTAITVSGLEFWRGRTHLNSFFRRRLLKGIRSADFCIASSDKVANELTSIFQLPNVHTIYPATETGVYTPASKEKDPQLILHLGSTGEDSGVERIFQLLVDLPHEYRLLQVGGCFSRKQKATLAELSLVNRVKQYSYVEHKRIVQYLQTAGLVLVPARYSGFGLRAVEARLCGTSVVIGNEIPAREVLSEDPGTLVVDFSVFDFGADEVDRQNVVQLIDRFPKKASEPEDREKFGWPRHAERCLEVYAGLVQSKVAS